MNPSSRYKLLSILTAFVLVFSLVAPVPAFASDGPPEDPTPTVEPSEPVAEEAASEEVTTEEAVTEEVATEEVASEEAATEEVVTEETTATEETATEEVATEEVATEEVVVEETVADIAVALNEADAVLVDSEGEPISLASTEAQELLSAPDPWFEDPGDATQVIAFQASCAGWTVPAGYAGGVCNVSSTPIQAAINAAVNPGTVIHVEDGDFNENVNVNKSVILTGANANIDPNTGTRGAESVINGQVTISSSDVIINGFTIKNPNGFFGISMTGNYNNIVITNNIVTEVGTNSTGSPSAGILIQPSVGSDNIEISNNLVDTIEASGNKTAQGIGILDSSGTGQITNLTIEENVISNVTSDRGAYGIQINHGANSTGSTQGAEILNNTIYNIDGKWAHGIGLEGDTPNALVEGNSVDNITGTFNGVITDSAAVTLQSNDGADSVVIRGNSFTNAEYGVINMTALAVDASGNWWGTTDASEVSALMLSLANNIDYSPYLASGADQSGAAGFQGDFSVLIVDAASPQTEAHIKNALSLLEPGGTLMILPGTFYENVQVDKSATLQGSGQGATIIMPANNNANTCTGSCPSATNTVVWVLADGVSIFDLTVDGDSDLLAGGQSVGGADINAHNGIVTNSNTDLTVQDVTVQNIYSRGIQMGAGGGTFDFSNNTINNVQGAYYSMGIFNYTSGGVIANNTISDVSDGIAMNWSTGTQVTNNTISNAGSGIHTDNAQGSDVIDGNTILNGKTNSYGIFVFAPYQPITVSNNTVDNVDYGLTLSGNGFGSSLNEITFDNNTVDANLFGAYITSDVWGYFKSNANATFSNNTLSGGQYGVYLESQAASDYTPGYYGASDCGGGDCTVQVTLICNDITGQIFEATGGIFWDGDTTPNYNGIYIVDDSGNVCTVTPPTTTPDGGDDDEDEDDDTAPIPPTLPGFIPVTGGQTLTLDLSPEALLAALEETGDQFPLTEADGQYSFACVLTSVTTLTEDTYITVGDQVVTSVGQCSYLVGGEVQTLTVALSFLGATETFAPGSVLTVGMLADDVTASFAGSGNPFDANNFLVASELELTGSVLD